MSQDPRALLQKAQKAESGAGGFSLFGNKTQKWEDAADFYTQAANAYRIQNNDEEAGRWFEKAADIQKNNLNEPDDAANTLQDAFKSYRQCNPEKAASALNKAVTHYADKGNLRRAATHQQSLAGLYETELEDIERAVQAYELAGNWFKKDNSDAMANKSFLKAADLAALLAAAAGDKADEAKNPAEKNDLEDKALRLYDQAYNHYENIAQQSMANNLMRWSVKDYLFKAGICHLATNDMVGANKALEKYTGIDNGFSQSREYQLLVDLMEAHEKGDEQSATDKMFQFDQMSKMDNWKVTMLLRFKKNIQQQEEDFA